MVVTRSLGPSSAIGLWKLWRERCGRGGNVLSGYDFCAGQNLYRIWGNC